MQGFALLVAVGVLILKIGNLMAFTPIDTTLKASCLYISPLNPRRNLLLSGPDWTEFVDSIKSFGGIHTPLFVRKRRQEVGEGTHEVLAGQRRYFGSIDALGPDVELPVRIFETSDFEAACLAISENTEREKMSIVDEAEAAANLLGFVKGDRAEAAKHMGWSVATLNHRLKLIACSPTVRAGIVASTITLAQAELLAGLRSDDQDKLLQGYPAGLPAAKELEAVILTTTGALDRAIFDKSECATCPQNSAQQKALFGTFGDGHCLNIDCYKAKTDGALDTKANELKQKYAVVQIIRPGERMTVAPVRPETVGEAQSTACRSCANFGACVSGMPDSLGKVAEGFCFDVSCNQQKVSTWQGYLAAVKRDAAQAAQKPATGKEKTATKGKKVGSKADNPPPAPATVKAPAPTIIALREPIRAWRDKLYATVLKTELAGHPELRALFTLALVTVGREDAIDTQKLREQLVGVGKIKDASRRLPVADVLQQLMTSMDKDLATKACTLLGVMSLEKLDRKELNSLVKLLSVDLSKYFRLDDAAHRTLLTDVLTKNEIAALCHEVGVDTALGKTYTSLVNGKKDALIAAVCGLKDFEYAGLVPKFLLPESPTQGEMRGGSSREPDAGTEDPDHDGESVDKEEAGAVA